EPGPSWSASYVPLTTPDRCALPTATRSSVTRGRPETIVHLSFKSARWTGNGPTNTFGMSSCVALTVPANFPPASLAVSVAVTPDTPGRYPEVLQATFLNPPRTEYAFERSN